MNFDFVRLSIFWISLPFDFGPVWILTPQNFGKTHKLNNVKIERKKSQFIVIINENRSNTTFSPFSLTKF